MGISTLRIAHVSRWHIPGTSYQENMLPAWQAEHGCEVSLITSNHVPSDFRGIVAGGFVAGATLENGVVVLRSHSIRFPFWDQVHIRQLCSKLYQIRPDIVHLHGLWAIPTLQVLRSCGPRAVVADDHTDNGNLPTGPGAWARFMLGRWAVKKIVGRNGLVVSVNPYSQRFVRSVLGVPVSSSALLPLGVDTQAFHPDGDARIEVRKELGFVDGKECVFLTSGRLAPGKGLRLLLESFADTLRQNSNVRLVIVGSGKKAYESSLIDLARKLYSEDVVTFVPWANKRELCRYYNAADVGVMPGKLGGMKEILSVGKPLIIPDHEATNYLIRNNNGLRFAEGDQESLAATMQRYSNDERLRIRHGERALDYAKRELSWGRIANDSISIYRRIISDRDRSERL